MNTLVCHQSCDDMWCRPTVDEVTHQPLIYRVTIKFALDPRHLQVLKVYRITVVYITVCILSDEHLYTTLLLQPAELCHHCDSRGGLQMD